VLAVCKHGFSGPRALNCGKDAGGSDDKDQLQNYGKQDVLHRWLGLARNFEQLASTARWF
jgi:hypothetical protein